VGGGDRDGQRRTKGKKRRRREQGLSHPIMLYTSVTSFNNRVWIESPKGVGRGQGGGRGKRRRGGKRGFLLGSIGSTGRNQKKCMKGKKGEKKRGIEERCGQFPSKLPPLVRILGEKKRKREGEGRKGGRGRPIFICDITFSWPKGGKVPKKEKGEKKKRKRERKGSIFASNLTRIIFKICTKREGESNNISLTTTTIIIKIYISCCLRGMKGGRGDHHRRGKKKRGGGRGKGKRGRIQ